ncbi:hypothetical protein JB92DRAFT_2929232 [Gautieria morchelliformis]|nr:hypothetical protein JB92DRAFT_2929232 [Gautieria morchelliformis]
MSEIVWFAIYALFFTSHVAAQTASVTAVCTYADWTFYKGQSPCQVWGNLQAACNPNASVGKLDTSTNIDATYPSV